MQLELFLVDGVARATRLDLRARHGELVAILRLARWRARRHDLRDEPLLSLDGLPHIGIEGRIRDVAEDLDVFVFVAAPDDTPETLLELAWLPRAIQIVRGDELVLHVRPNAELVRRAEEDAHLALSHLLEKRLLRSHE